MRTLLVGGTGYLGLKIAAESVRAGIQLIALVRRGTDDEPLKSLGVEIVRGDITEERSLPTALADVSAVITAAAGYTSRRTGDSLASVDDRGNRNLADAAAAAGVTRFVFISVLTADTAVSVPHFHQKYLTEQYIFNAGLPVVALRPGGFLDQVLGWNRDQILSGTMPTVIDPDAPLTCLLAEDIARYAVAALTSDGIIGRSIDLGMESPLTFRSVASVLSRVLRRPISMTHTPPPAAPTAELEASIAWMSTGHYVADTTLQQHFFGQLPTLEDSLRRWVSAVT